MQLIMYTGLTQKLSIIYSCWERLTVSAKEAKTHSSRKFTYLLQKIYNLS